MLNLPNPFYADVKLPTAMAKKYRSAPKELNWHYLFPSRRTSIDPEDNVLRRHHIDESTIQKAIRASAKHAGITKQVTPHTLRHSFANELTRHPSYHSLQKIDYSSYWPIIFFAINEEILTCLS